MAFIFFGIIRTLKDQIKHFTHKEGDFLLVISTLLSGGSTLLLILRLILLSEGALGNAGLCEGGVGGSLLLISSDGTGLLAARNSDERQLLALLDCSSNISGSRNILALNGGLLGGLLTLLESLASLVGLTGEQDKLALVDLQTLGVSLKRSFRVVGAAVVNSDAKLLSLILGDTGSLNEYKPGK